MSLTDTADASTSANDTIVDLFTERAVDLLRLEAGSRDKAVLLLNDLDSEIAAAISKIDPASATGNAAKQRARLASLQQIVESSIQATYRLASTQMTNEVRDVADTESNWTANAINFAIKAEFADAGLTASGLDNLVSNILIQGAPTAEWWGRQAQGLSDKFADQMRLGVAAGESNSDLIDRVRGTNEKPGIMDIARNSAERLVRSSVQTAANAGRTATYQNNSDLIAAVQWHSTLDTRTSEWCIVRDGLQYTVTTHEPLDSDVPWLSGPGALHWMCRSTSIPVMKSWRDLGIDADEIPDSTRASMDGQVPAKTTFESWLKKQSKARQDTVLGPGKADLWRAGKITFRDLLNQDGRPLTTEQLRAKYAKRGQ